MLSTIAAIVTMTNGITTCMSKSKANSLYIGRAMKGWSLSWAKVDISKIPKAAEMVKPNTMPAKAVYGLRGFINNVQANMKTKVSVDTIRWLGSYSGNDVPKKYFNPVGNVLIPKMKIIVPVTSGGNSFLKLNVNEPKIPFNMPENTVIPNTSGMPPICAAMIQAANAAESDTDKD